MGDHHHRRPLLGELPQPVQDDAGGIDVQGPGGLVGEDDLRLAGHHPGNRHSLALAPGELMGLETGAVPEPDGLKGILDLARG